MIFANERAQNGLELFDIDGTESFEMKNETLRMCADEDGSIWYSVRGLTIKDADGNIILDETKKEIIGVNEEFWEIILEYEKVFQDLKQLVEMLQAEVEELKQNRL